MSRLASQEYFQFVLATFELQNPLHYASFGELGSGDFDRQLEVLFFALPRHVQNRVGAGLFFPQKVERMANHPQLQISRGCSGNNTILGVFQKNALRFSLLLQLFGLAA